jgi:hypothetical protein
VITVLFVSKSYRIPENPINTETQPENTARLHRILSKDDDNKMDAFRLPSRALTSSTDQEVAEHLLETHFPGCQPISGPQSQSQPITPSTEDWLTASSVITQEKIRWAYNGFGSYKTVGETKFFRASCNKELKLWLCHYVKYSRLIWLSAMFPKLGKK